MYDHAALVQFTLVALVFGVTPGPDVILSIRQSLVSGTAFGVVVALGAASGSLVWGVAAATGLSTLLGHAPVAFHAIKIAGAVYLGFLGIQSIRRAGSLHDLTETTPDLRSGSRWAAFKTGFVMDLLNPKMGAFYLALIPQFIPAGGDVLKWSLLFMAIELVIAILALSGYALIADRARRLLKSRHALAWLERILGVFLIGLGIRVAFD